MRAVTLPPRNAEGERGFAHGVRNKAKRLVGRPDDDRKQDHRQRERAGEPREMARSADDEFVDEKADHDRRRA